MLIEELSRYGVPGKYIELLSRRGIRELNPVQEASIEKGLFSRVNMVIAAPTASGKTLIGEMALVRDALEGKMSVYLTPLRALASEKYEDFKILEELGLRVGITTGDYDQPAEYLGEYDILVATYERFDSLLRLNPSWLRRVSVVVIDELHNISDPDRGPIVEMIATRSLKRGIRIIGLSATIGNPESLAKWLNAELVVSTWRPVKLVEAVFDRKRSVIVFRDFKMEKVDEVTDDHIINLIIHNTRLNLQTLVFIHNRKRVEEYAQQVASYLNPLANSEIKRLIDEIEEAPTRLERELLGELLLRGVGFHHAGLSYPSRRVVEEAFRKRLLSVVFATPTLAAGVNLPARRVLVSIKRYDPVKGRRVNISISEYKQMAGRAGRPQYDELGEAIIIDASNVQEGFKYIMGTPEPVRGNLLSERSLRIHTLSLIASSDASSINEVLGVFNKTFTAHEIGGFNEEKIKEVLKLLEELNMIEFKRDRITPTRLGKLTSFTYLDPLTVSMFFKYKPVDFNELYILHLVALTPDFTRTGAYISSSILYKYEEQAHMLYEQGLLMPIVSDYYGYEDWLQGFIYAMALYDWINEKNEDEILDKYGLGPGDLYNMRDTASWITGALGKISGIMGLVGFNKKMLQLSMRLEKGVKEDALELASLRYIGRVRARILIEHGIKTLEDLAKIPKKRLALLPKFGPKIADEIHRQLKELGFNPPP